MRSVRVLAVLVGGLAVMSGSLSGQEVRFRRGAGGVALADQVLRRTLAAGAYRVIARDSVLAADEVIDGDVIVLSASLRLEGRVEGNLIGVQSDIFARPGARVSGAVVVMAGGFYGSALAHLESPPIDASIHDYRVESRPDGAYVITAPGSRADLRLPGLYGFLLPRYDRVNAVTIRWGVEYSPGQRPLVPHVRGEALFHTARTDAGGELEIWWPVGRHEVSLRGGRVTRSHDSWTQGEVENSVTSLLAAMDTRSYYDARFVEAGLRIESGTRTQWLIDLKSAWERARSLDGEDPFSVFSVHGGFRPNTPVAEIDLLSAAVGLGVRTWRGVETAIELDGQLEAAGRDYGSDDDFVLLSGRLRASIGRGAAGSLDFWARGQVPTGSDEPPPQRWRSLGGWGSLPTLRPLERQGERMWWTALEYRPPVTLRLAYFGGLVPWARYAVGNAWRDRSPPRPPAVHNLGVGLASGRLEIGVFSDPEADFETVLTLGFSRPAGAGRGR